MIFKQDTPDKRTQQSLWYWWHKFSQGKEARSPASTLNCSREMTFPRRNILAS